MPAGPAIIVTGLPASGKTTVGRMIARMTALPMLDKDDFLEALYDTRGIGDRAWRQALSRESDALFQAEALRHEGVILVSHWQPRGVTGTGTATDWLGAFDRIVEVHCACPPDIAADRFKARRRHPGHLDAERPHADVQQRMKAMATGYPLGLGETVRVDCEVAIDKTHLREALAGFGLL